MIIEAGLLGDVYVSTKDLLSRVDEVLSKVKTSTLSMGSILDVFEDAELDKHGDYCWKLSTSVCFLTKRIRNKISVSTKLYKFLSELPEWQQSTSLVYRP